jgi:hypothetical protein
MSSKLINTEALDNSIYNPPVDKKTLMLQSIMESEPIPPDARTQPRRPPLLDVNEVEFALRDHLNSINGLSVFNPYHGVIVNPTKCLLDPIRTDLMSMTDYLSGRFSDDGTWMSYRDEYNTDIYGANDSDADDQGILGDLDSIEDHTDRLTNNLPSLAGIAQAALALDTVMNLLSNPCLGLDGFLGSIMDKGKALINDVKNRISSLLARARAWVSGTIGPLIDEIRGALAAVKAKVAQLISMAKAEVLKFAKALLAQARQGLADLLSNLPKDPCLRGLLGAVVTGAAAAVIGG